MMVMQLQLLCRALKPRRLSLVEENLFSYLSRINIAVNSDDFGLNRIKPLLNAVLDNKPDERI
jgi:hypothetical protein